MTRRFLVASVLLSAMLAACSGATQYGGKIDTSALGKGGALGNFIAKQSPGATASAAPKTGPTAKASSTANANQHQQVSLTVKISQSGFDPYVVSVYTGGIIRFVNKDTRVHRVINDPSAGITVDSGDLKPGQSWDYVANTPGTFRFDDQYTPYFYFQIKVIKK